MRDVLNVVGQTLEDLWDHLFLGAGCSLLWLALTMLVLPAPGATLALVDIAQRVHARESPSLGDYWRSVWSHLGLGWRWAAYAVPVVVVLWVNLRTAPALFPDMLAVVMQGFAAVALACWSVVLAYSLPILFRQEERSVPQALRNGGVMALRNPLFTLLLFSIAALFLSVSLLLVVVNLLAGPIFCAFLATRAVDSRLDIWRAEQVQL